MLLMKTPRTVDISITSKCNSRCIYCSHFNGSGDVEKDLAYAEWARFFKELKKCAVMDVILAGGEPFFYPEIDKLISSVVENKMRYSILSNGSLIDDKMASFLSATKRCNAIQISIDGPNASIHDICRGSGSFEKAIRGLKILLKHNLPATVRVTINKHNVRYLKETAAFLLEELNLSSFSTNSASYSGLCMQNDNAIQLDIEERSLAMDTLLMLNKKYNNRITAMAGPLKEAVYWLQMEKNSEEKSKREADGTEKMGFLVGCNCVWSKLAVRSDGVIVPCNQLAHIELGKINEDDFASLWQNNEFLKSLRERKNIPLSNFDYCRDCHYIAYCTGNCPALAYNYHGDIYAPSPDACLKFYLEQGGKLPAAN